MQKDFSDIDHNPDEVHTRRPDVAEGSNDVSVGGNSDTDQVESENPNSGESDLDEVLKRWKLNYHEAAIYLQVTILEVLICGIIWFKMMPEHFHMADTKRRNEKWLSSLFSRKERTMTSLTHIQEAKRHSQHT